MLVLYRSASRHVTPAKAGVHFTVDKGWIPAFEGMTAAAHSLVTRGRSHTPVINALGDVMRMIATVVAVLPGHAVMLDFH